MRTKVVAGNWKMNLSKSAAIEIASGLKTAPIPNGSKAYCFPSAIHLADVASILKDTKVVVGSQNIYPSNNAAFTGEISPDQLADYGIHTTLLGHSERRQFLGETNEFLKKKAEFCISKNLEVVFCIGETLEEREKGQTNAVLEKQILEGLKGLDLSKFLIAYEPVWAIGTGKTATTSQAEEAHEFLRGLLKKNWNSATSDATPILYGGSVKEENFKELLASPNIDGGLIGGASQKKDSFLSLIKLSE